jgi:hypothetical protein
MYNETGAKRSNEPRRAYIVGFLSMKTSHDTTPRSFLAGEKETARENAPKRKTSISDTPQQQKRE